MNLIVTMAQIEKARVSVQPLHGLDIKRAMAGPSTKDDLDIPESVGLPTQPPASSLSARLRGRRKL